MTLSWDDCRKRLARWNGPVAARLAAADVIAFWEAEREYLPMQFILWATAIEIDWHFPDSDRRIVIAADGGMSETTMIDGFATHAREFTV